MNAISKVLKIYDDQSRVVVAQVILNGYDIRAGETTVPHGAMRSFKIVNGDLWEHWNLQSPLVLSNDEGQEAPVKVAALPADADSFGLIEFL
jgi:hypothetical protein